MPRHLISTFLLPLLLVFIKWGLSDASANAAEDPKPTAAMYEPVASFPTLPPDIVLGECAGVGLDSKGNIYVLNRGKHPIVCFDPQGRFIRTWGENLIAKGHGLCIDAGDHIWATDVGHHMIFKFRPDGKVLSSLGRQDKPGLENDQFNQPTQLAFAPSGEFYVTDGYGNSRVIKFDANGRFVKTWGTPGKEKGQFKSPHAALIDKNGRVIVCDRDNNRIQVFDSEGNHLETWSEGYKPFCIVYDREGNLIVADGEAHRILQVDDHGKIVSAWGQKGTAAGEFNVPHMLAIDGDNSLYVVEIANKRLQKFVRKP